MSDLEAALRDYLKDAPPVLSPDGQYMRTMDGRPVVIDVVAAHIALAALRAEPAPRDFFTREAVTGLCPACGAGWTGSPCPTCGFVAPVPVDVQGRPFAPSPAPRDEARKDIASRAREMANDARLSMIPVARHLLDECATEIDVLNRKLIDMYERIIPEQIQAALAAASRADPSGPMQFGRDFMLEDLWAAYRQGAKEMRELTVILTNSRRDLPVDAEIERACDAYVKLIVGRAAARAPGREP